MGSRRGAKRQAKAPKPQAPRPHQRVHDRRVRKHGVDRRRHDACRELEAGADRCGRRARCAAAACAAGASGSAGGAGARGAGEARDPTLPGPFAPREPQARRSMPRTRQGSGTPGARATPAGRAPRPDLHRPQPAPRAALVMVRWKMRGRPLVPESGLASALQRRAPGRRWHTATCTPPGLSPPPRPGRPRLRGHISACGSHDTQHPPAGTTSRVGSKRCLAAVGQGTGPRGRACRQPGRARGDETPAPVARRPSPLQRTAFAPPVAPGCSHDDEKLSVYICAGLTWAGVGCPARGQPLAQAQRAAHPSPRPGAWRRHRGGNSAVAPPGPAPGRGWHPAGGGAGSARVRCGRTEGCAARRRPARGATGGGRVLELV
jgi:hypothetical protein